MVGSAKIHAFQSFGDNSLRLQPLGLKIGEHLRKGCVVVHLEGFYPALLRLGDIRKFLIVVIYGDISRAYTPIPISTTVCPRIVIISF